jgi:hypothetical protein
MILGGGAWARPLIIPFVMSSPEYGIGFGVKARDRGLFGGPGFGDLTGMYTTRGQWYVELSGLRDSIAGNCRLGGTVEGGVFPELYSGEGSPAPKASLAGYTPTYALASMFAGYWFQGGIRMDLGLAIDHREIERSDTGAMAGWARRTRGYPDGGTQVRVSVEGEWNRLDHPADPHSGTTLVARFEPPVPGSAWALGFIQGTLIETPFAAGPTMVLRARHEAAGGDVPFWKIPSAGKSRLLRGLSDYRVRGRSLQALGSELRQPLAILGFATEAVAFGEAARAGDEGGVWSSDPVFGFGCGGRLLLDDRHAVLRVDLGWNTSSEATVAPALYVDFGQAF